MNYNDLDNLDHDQKLAEALGNMVVAWAKAETALLNVYAWITDIHFNMATFAYYRIPTFEARVKVIQGFLEFSEQVPNESSARDLNKNKIQKLTTVINKLRELSLTRNRWIHGVWCVETTRPITVIFNFRAPTESAKRKKPIKANDVQNHVRAVRKRTAEIENLVPFPHRPD